MNHPISVRRFAGLFVPALVVTVFLATSAWAYSSGSETAGDMPSRIGVKLASAKEIKQLNKTGGKVRLVNFWATWCAPCRAEFPELVGLYQKYEPKGLEFVTVSADDKGSQEQVVRFLDEHQASGTNLLYDGQDTAGMLKSFDRKWQEILPYTVVFDGRGQVVFRREGQVTVSELEKVLEQQLGGTGDR
ncbi:MAG: TlpA disulfide reductase family protein [Acidobacteriota bacterium]